MDSFEQEHPHPSVKDSQGVALSMLGFVCLFICCCCFKYLDTAVETVTLNSWDTDLQHLRCPAVCATSCEGFVETS